MNSALAACLAWLLVLCVQGQMESSSNCKCWNGHISRIHPKFIMKKAVIHPPSIFCKQTEIIVTITGNKEKCISPRSRLGQLILENNNKRRSKGAASTTVATGQTNTWSSTTVHSTSKL